MKKKAYFLLILMIPAFILSGCAPVVKDEDIEENYSVYASFLPAYMLSELIIGDEIPGLNLHLLIQPQDGCMRSYALSDWDQYVLLNADAVILIGNGLETFESALMNMGQNGPSVISASSSLVLDSSGAAENDESHLNGANPWLFLSVEGGLHLTEAIAANMIALDPDYEERYIENLKRAYERFEGLKSEIDEIAQNIDSHRRVALAHEGLIYTAKDLGLNVVLRIDRESGEYPDDASLSDMLKQLEASNTEVVLIESQAPNALTKALRAAGYEVVLMDTLSSGTPQNGAEGYFKRVMENARLVQRALPK
ncbi:MAG: metal ABC transporter substrate-binding protein [Clostridia bacterium]|nr:metal ABC transporter substrate-binding protein [Clostridia bacterium]